MPFSDTIQEANTELETFFLLTAYVEALGYCDKLKLLPWQTRDLPLAGADDVKARIHGLHLWLCENMASDAGHGVRLIVEEALTVFRTAMRRLAFLHADGGLFQAA